MSFLRVLLLFYFHSILILALPHEKITINLDIHVEGTNRNPVCIEREVDGPDGHNQFRATQIIDPAALNLDTRTKQWSGYFGPDDQQAPATKLFFWIFESRRDASKDPVILWLNGGPGASSLYGAFTQWGPKRMKENGNFEDNPAILNEENTLVFLEQPVGVGFSYSTLPTTIDTSAKAAVDVLAFLKVLFAVDTFPGGRTYYNSDLHIGGESYAGHYIPHIVKAIVSEPLPPLPKRPLELKSVFIGNGIYDLLIQQRTIYQMACDKTLKFNRDWLLSDDQCAEFNTKLIACETAIRNCQRDGGDYCLYGWRDPCNACGSGKYQQLKGRDQYDLTQKVELGQPRNKVEGGLLATWVNSVCPRVGARACGTWLMENGQVKVNFQQTGDEIKSVLSELSEVLATASPYYQGKLRMMLYAGDTDLRAPFLGTAAIADRITWGDRDKFIKAPLAPYTANGKKSGEYKKYGRLMYARVYGAGHMINENKPEVSKELFLKWIKGEWVDSAQAPAMFVEGHKVEGDGQEVLSEIPEDL